MIHNEKKKVRLHIMYSVLFGSSVAYTKKQINIWILNHVYMERLKQLFSYNSFSQQ